MRGARIRVGIHETVIRIIPADAGSTAPARRWSRSPQDHPRGCGEHWAAVNLNDPITGSSPRMRGAPMMADTRRPIPWIIPADAGSTVAQTNPVIEEKDHPRGCGEHSRARVPSRSLDGSSPRMRGARLPNHQHRDSPRIIPADAGSTIRP